MSLNVMVTVESVGVESNRGGSAFSGASLAQLLKLVVDDCLGNTTGDERARITRTLYSIVQVLKFHRQDQVRNLVAIIHQSGEAKKAGELPNFSFECSGSPARVHFRGLTSQNGLITFTLLLGPESLSCSIHAYGSEILRILEQYSARSCWLCDGEPSDLVTVVVTAATERIGTFRAESTLGVPEESRQAHG